jgi:hypothetical protein
VSEKLRDGFEQRLQTSLGSAYTLERELMMRGTRVIGDSIVGDGTGAMGRIAVPVAGVRTVEELRTNRALTAVLAIVGGGAALAGLALFAFVQAMGD